MRPARLERATYSFGGCHSIQLSYGRSEREYNGRAQNHNRALEDRRCAILISRDTDDTEVVPPTPPL